ncbi:hypothetical protein [Ornithinimicrobium sufpigmenti]|uniref:hypothetical protein n=1 Tax=Ornithinimicrobium sufpigmenti TaxID=2508882 RepID=UPI0010359D6A|nr:MULTISPECIES: hypothetical protein [unclassified Ornithinimicrobium]
MITGTRARSWFVAGGLAPLVIATGAFAAPHEPDTAVEGVFAPDSPFYRPLPDDTPVAADSEALIAGLYQQAIDYFGRPGQPNVTINIDNYTAPLYITSTDDPQQDIRPWNCQDKEEGWDAELAEMWSGQHLPSNLKPDGSSDGNVSIYNADTGTLVELWQARQAPDGVWEACWGGVIEDASVSPGTFAVPYGASAGGMALWAYTIRHDELLEGEINHVIGLTIPEIKKGVISWPATRTDGRVDGTEIAMGQLLRLPADFDLDSLNLSPSARTVAQAAQDYGIVITDTSGAVAFAGEHEFGLVDNRYDEIFRGRYAYEEMAGDPALGEDPFPLQELVALPVDYGKDLPWPPEDAPAAVGGDEAVATLAETNAASPPSDARPNAASPAEAPDAAFPWPPVLIGLLVAAGAVVAGLTLRRRRL